MNCESTTAEFAEGLNVEPILLTKEPSESYKEGLKDRAKNPYAYEPIPTLDDLEKIMEASRKKTQAAEKKLNHADVIFSPDLKEVVKEKLTVGKVYPVKERDLTKYTILIVDDEGKETWIGDQHFVPVPKLLGGFEEETADSEKGVYWKDHEDYLKCPLPTKKDKPCDTYRSKDNLSWSGLEICAEVPSIRTKKLADRIFEPEKVEETTLKELARLAGIKKTVYEEKYEKEWHIPPLKNDLLENVDKLMENMNSVFHPIINDDILKAVKVHFPKRKLLWDDGYLTVDGARTTVEKAAVDKVCEGMRSLTAKPKSAEKMVVKAIVAKLKKLF